MREDCAIWFCHSLQSAVLFGKSIWHKLCDRFFKPIQLAKYIRLPLLAVGVFGGWFAVIVPAFAQTWTQANVPTTNLWTGIASSADGTKLIAVAANDSAVYTSTNSGASWISNNVPDDAGAWSAVASSANGTKLAAAQNYGGIYTSTNSGVTWQLTSAPNSQWHSIASSADGSKVAAINYWIYTSTNFRATWTQTSAPGGGWISVASSADGNCLVAAPFSGSIYTSTNSGATWIETSSPANNFWRSVVSSADGTKLAALSADFIYCSTNSGATWIVRTNVTSNGYSIISSADGNKLAAAIHTRIYTSINSGITWQQQNSAPLINNGYSIVSSADGYKLVAAVFAGPIYTLQTMPSPQLNLASSNTNLALSWTIPSTNFMLQQSADLISWAGVTNTPMLNLTNLQNQVTLAPSNRSGFYRLKTP